MAAADGGLLFVCNVLREGLVSCKLFFLDLLGPVDARAAGLNGGRMGDTSREGEGELVAEAARVWTLGAGLVKGSRVVRLEVVVVVDGFAGGLLLGKGNCNGSEISCTPVPPTMEAKAGVWSSMVVACFFWGCGTTCVRFWTESKKTVLGCTRQARRRGERRE